MALNLVFSPSKPYLGRSRVPSLRTRRLARGSLPRTVICAASEMKTSTKTQLQSLREMSTVVADTGEIDLVKKYMPVDCTTNPSLVLKAVQQPEYAHFLQQAVDEEAANPSPVTTERPYAAIADRLAVLMGCELLKIVPGRVSTEVDAHLSYNTEATVQLALRLVSLYDEKGIGPERLYIKIASTWEGIEACKQLEKRGINCNMTLLFSFAQAVACGLAGATLISPFVGRILDWYRANTGRDYAPEEDPGVLSVRKIFNYYKAYDQKTIVMAASFRNAGEIQELAGCDNITISPALLGELEKSTEPLPRQLDPKLKASDDTEIKTMDEKLFREMHASDKMASDKLAEGVENFAADQRKLEELIGALVKK